jgi:hypothetical protein
MQLHSWDDEEHPNLVEAARARAGHGVLLWFEVDDFDAAVSRARALMARVVEDVHVNENAQQRELWLRDADGYVVVLAGPLEVTARPRTRRRSRSGSRAEPRPGRR